MDEFSSATVYSASKAGLVRFVESVNIELELSEQESYRCSPASFKGSRFYGGKNDLSITGPFAKEVLNGCYERNTIYPSV